MAQSTTPRLRSQFQRLRNPPAPQPELGLEGILPKLTVQTIRAEEGADWKEIFSTPWVTFGTFFGPMLSPDRSCRAALKRLGAGMGRHAQELEDEDTGASCKARARWPEAALRRLLRRLGSQAHRRAPQPWRWCGRAVQVVDGSTVLLPDTQAHPAASPQSPSQKPGWGFPMARIVVLFGLATGSVLELAIGQYRGKQTGEKALFRSRHEQLEPEDVVLGDRSSGSDFDIALLKQRGVDSVFRRHQRRSCDFRRGRRLGKEDQVVTWWRPDRPDGMEEAA